jgi:hypothetical protein
MGPIELANFIEVYEMVKRNQRYGYPTVFEVSQRIGERPFLDMIGARLITIEHPKLILFENYVRVSEEGVALMLKVEDFIECLKEPIAGVKPSRKRKPITAQAAG